MTEENYMLDDRAKDLLTDPEEKLNKITSYLFELGVIHRIENHSLSSTNYFILILS